MNNTLIVTVLAPGLAVAQNSIAGKEGSAPGGGVRNGERLRRGEGFRVPWLSPLKMIQTQRALGARAINTSASRTRPPSSTFCEK